MFAIYQQFETVTFIVIRINHAQSHRKINRSKLDKKVTSVLQESLADAKVRARQHCVYEGS